MPQAPDKHTNKENRNKNPSRLADILLSLGNKGEDVPKTVRSTAEIEQQSDIYFCKIRNLCFPDSFQIRDKHWSTAFSHSIALLLTCSSWGQKIVPPPRELVEYHYHDILVIGLAESMHEKCSKWQTLLYVGCFAFSFCLDFCIVLKPTNFRQSSPIL